MKKFRGAHKVRFIAHETVEDATRESHEVSHAIYGQIHFGKRFKLLMASTAEIFWCISFFQNVTIVWLADSPAPYCGSACLVGYKHPDGATVTAPAIACAPPTSLDHR
jgi:hypothetical protein